MFSLGGGELLLIAVIALVLFGPDKVPQMARTVGRLMREFNKYRDIMESTVRAEMYKTDRESGEPADERQADLDKMTKAAKASQDLIAERAAAEAAEGREEPAEPTAGGPATDEDEDEEDGA